MKLDITVRQIMKKNKLNRPEIFKKIKEICKGKYSKICRRLQRRRFMVISLRVESIMLHAFLETKWSIISRKKVTVRIQLKPNNALISSKVSLGTATNLLQKTWFASNKPPSAISNT
jgi:hypothetical protein